MGAEPSLVQGLPLATCPQDKEDAISTGAIGYARSPAAKAMGIDMDRQQWLQDMPQFVGDAKTSGGRVVRCALSRSWVLIVSAHTCQFTRLFG